MIMSHSYHPSAIPLDLWFFERGLGVIIKKQKIVLKSHL